MRRHYCRLLAALILLSSPLAAQAQGDPFALLFGDEETLDSGATDRAGQDDVRFVGLRLGGLRLTETITAYAYEDELCVLPASLFGVLDAPIAVDDNGASGWFVSPERTIEIDAEEQTATLSAQSSLALEGRVHDTPEGWCLGLSALSEILPINFTYNSTSQTLAMEPRETLPLEAKLEREALRTQLDSAAGRVRPNYRRVENPYRLLSLPTADLNLDVRAASDSTFAIDGQIDLAGDILWTTARIRSARNLSGDTGVRATFERVFSHEDRMWMPKQVRFGDVAALNQPLTSKGSAGRGFMVSNRPTYAADVFDMTDIRGPLPTGWEAELYRDSQLVAFVTEPDEQGEYLFKDVEILPGYNRYTVKLFGPQGETDTRDVKFFAGSEMYPENTVYYDIAVLEEGVTVDGNVADVPTPVVSASVSAGITRQVSTRLDLRAEANTPMMATASVYAASGNTHGVARLQGVGAAAPALEVGAVHLFEDRSSIDARYFRFSDIVSGDTDGAQSLKQSLQMEYNTTLPLTSWGLPLQSRLAWSEMTNGDAFISASARVSSSFKGWRWTHLAHLKQTSTATNSQTEIGGRFGFSRSLSGMRVRGGVDYEIGPKLQASKVDIQVQRRLSRAGFAQFNLSHDMIDGATTAGANFSRAFGDFTLSTNAGVSDRGEWTMGLRLSTALFFDRKSNRYRTGPSGMSRTGAIRANVFDDLNENGAYDEDDQEIAGAAFIVDRSIRREETGPDGAVTLGGVASHRPLDLEVALGTLSDPFLQPLERGMSVTVRPGQVLDVDVPLSLTGEIDGTVTMLNDGHSVPVAGVRVEALDDAGNVVGTSTSEYDGYVYLDGLPMGDIELRIPQSALTEVGATSNPVEVSLDRKEPSAFGLDMLIVKTQPSS